MYFSFPRRQVSAVGTLRIRIASPGGLLCLWPTCLLISLTSFGFQTSNAFPGSPCVLSDSCTWHGPLTSLRPPGDSALSPAAPRGLCRLG